MATLRISLNPQRYLGERYHPLSLVDFLRGRDPCRPEWIDFFYAVSLHSRWHFFGKEGDSPPFLHFFCPSDRELYNFTQWPEPPTATFINHLLPQKGSLLFFGCPPPGLVGERLLCFLHPGPPKVISVGEPGCFRSTPLDPSRDRPIERIEFFRPATSHPMAVVTAQRVTSHLLEVGIEVHPNHRRRGVGSQLLDRMVNLSFQSGRTPIYLTEEKNLGSVKLCTKGGFQYYNDLWLVQW